MRVSDARDPRDPREVQKIVRGVCYAAIYMWAVVVHYYRPNGVPTCRSLLQKQRCAHRYIMFQTKHELQKRIDSRGKQISGAQSSTKHNLNGRSHPL